MGDCRKQTDSTNDFGTIAQLLCCGILLPSSQDLEQNIRAHRMTHQYYLCSMIVSRMAFNCPFEHLAYVLYLLFQIIWSFCVVTGSMLIFIVLQSESTKTRSCDFDVTVWIVGSKAVEAQREESAIVFYEAWISSDEEDQQ